MARSVDANIATVLVAALSLIGSIIVGFMQMRSSRQEKQSASEAEARKQAEDMKKKADEAEEKLKEREQQETLDEIRRTLDTLTAKVDNVSKNVQSVHSRVDAMQLKFSARLQETEESIDKITKLLSRYARTYSSLIAMNQQTSERVQQMIRMESYNLKFTKGVADFLDSMGTAVLGLHAAESDSRAYQSLQKVLDGVEVSRQDFLQNVMQENVNMFQNPTNQVKMEATPTQEEIDGAAMRHVDHSTFQDGHKYNSGHSD